MYLIITSIPGCRRRLNGWLNLFESGKPVLGICLGAQIIAAALGAEVYPGQEKEIGWYNLRFLPALGEFRICKELPATRKVFHWHGDTFHIPKGAARIARSQAFPNQGFIYNRQCIGPAVPPGSDSRIGKGPGGKLQG